MSVQGVPDNISEEFYQISDSILSSFPKYRPPVDFFLFNEKVMQLIPYSLKGVRLSNEQVEELAQQCENGNLFVARSDHHIYSQHIVKQLDLILVDRNLKEREITTICYDALQLKLQSFFESPVKPQMEELIVDIRVVTEYIWTDRHKIKSFVKRIWKGEEYSLVKHSINCMFLGLWVLLGAKDKEITRKFFDEVAIGLLLHDVGMTKIPAFILNKTKPLTLDEKGNIPPHVVTSASIIRKLDYVSQYIDQIVLEHHERLDGSGYPQKKKEISHLGRISGVVDSFSAMLFQRPYAEAIDMATAARKISAQQDQYDISVAGSILAAIISGDFGSTGSAK